MTRRSSRERRSVGGKSKTGAGHPEAASSETGDRKASEIGAWTDGEEHQESPLWQIGEGSGSVMWCSRMRHHKDNIQSMKPKVLTDVIACVK